MEKTQTYNIAIILYIFQILFAVTGIAISILGMMLRKKQDFRLGILLDKVFIFSLVFINCLVVVQMFVADMYLYKIFEYNIN